MSTESIKTLILYLKYIIKIMCYIFFYYFYLYFKHMFWKRPLYGFTDYNGFLLIYDRHKKICKLMFAFASFDKFWFYN